MAEVTCEDMFFVPGNVVEKSVGFALDAGGSAVKLVYRAKRDYTNGRCTNGEVPSGQGIVRTAVFLSSDIDHVVDFLAENCELKGGMKAYCTGMHSGEYEQKLMEKFDIGRQCQTELDMFIKAFRYLFLNFPRHTLVHPPHSQGLKEAQEFVAPLLEFSTISKDLTDGGIFPTLDNRVKEDDLETCELNPCLLSMMGSASLYYKIHKDWSFNVVDYTYLGGMSFLGIATGLCGQVVPYNDLMHLADVGKCRAMDVHGSDVKFKESSDIYGSTPDDMPFFPFGKMAFRQPDEFSLEDKIAGWVNLTCGHYAQYTHLQALLNGVDKVFMSGGFCDNPTTRRYITKHWLSRNTLFGMGKQVDIYFLKNGQHLGALGALLKEVEDAEAK